MSIQNIQEYLLTDNDYKKSLKKSGYKIRTYKKLNIISSPYKSDIKHDFSKYCRGLVIDPNRKIVCIPPQKAITVENIADLEIENNNLNFEELIDGTMINVFWFENNWLISTRSEIGGYNKWNDKKSFKDLFNECLDFDLNHLNKECCYSFVMRHMNNRNIAKIDKNELILVEMYNNFDRVDYDNYPDFCKKVNRSNKIEEIKYNLEKSDYLKGYTLKIDDKRYKVVNNNFEKIKKIKGNRNNLFLTYYDLRKNGKLKEYFNYFPENTSLFEGYRDKVHRFSNELYATYKDTYIYKKIEKKDVPYYLKPYMIGIHKKYLETKEPISWDMIKDYIYNLDSEKIYFSFQFTDY